MSEDVPEKRGNARGGKGLAVEPLGPGHILCTMRQVKDGNKTGLITCPVNGRVVLLKSRMRKNLKSGSVRAHSSYREEVAMSSTRHKPTLGGKNVFRNEHRRIQ